MKRKTILFTCIVAFASLMAFTFKPFHAETYRIDVSRSTVEWYAAKLTGKHNGTVKVSGGEIKNDHGRISGFIEMDMTSIMNTDMESAEYRSKLENHLKSEDFFDVAKYPKAKFVITSVTPVNDSKTAGATHTIKGMMTIKEITNEISFDAAIKTEASKMTCTGEMVVDRSKFNVKYGSKTFFADIGDKIIYDEFTLKFNVVAAK